MATDSILPLTVDRINEPAGNMMDNHQILYDLNIMNELDCLMAPNDFQASDDLLSELLATDQDFINGLFEGTSPLHPIPSPTTSASYSVPLQCNHTHQTHPFHDGSPISSEGLSPHWVATPPTICNPPSSSTYSSSSPSHMTCSEGDLGFHSNQSDHSGSGPGDICIDVEDLDEDNKLERSKSSDRKMGSLVLTQEEQKLLAEEGIYLPIDMPLTKSEERNLKRIRRKIKNKQSAADSRKRKKEYVDGLERRVEKCTEENQAYRQKISSLESENKSLMDQLRKLQAVVAKFNPSKTQTGGFLMIFMLSFSLFIVPHYFSNSQLSSPHNSGTSRTLLDVKGVDEFGNPIDPITGQVLYNIKGITPVPFPPWKFQTPSRLYNDL